MKKKTPKPAPIPEPPKTALIGAPLVHKRTRYGVLTTAPKKPLSASEPSASSVVESSSELPIEKKPRFRLVAGALARVENPGPLKTLPYGIVWYGDEYILTSQEENFDGAGGGVQTVSTYVGQPDAILELRATFLLAGTRFRFSRNVPSEITSYIDDTYDSGAPGTNNARAEEVWNLTWAENSRRLSTAPAFNTSTAVTQAIAKTEYSIDNKQLPDGTVITNVFTYDFNAAFPGAGTLPNAYRDARLLSTVGDSWVDRYPILVQRISQATTGQNQASLDQVNKIFSIDPKSSLNKLGNLTGWQWLKTPAEKDLFGGKITITQRYIGATSYPTPPFQAAT